MRVQKFTYEEVRKVILSKEYKFLDEGINIIGVRSANNSTNEWDDFLVIAYKQNGKEICLTYKDFTTDPGLYYLKTKLLNPKGCAILKEGQYVCMWKKGFHNNKYKALVQLGAKCVVYRDRNMDNVLDFNENSIDKGFFGINLHHGYDSKNVNANSAGCQVLRLSKDLSEVLSLVDQFPEQLYHTYTLLNMMDFQEMVSGENKTIEIQEADPGNQTEADIINSETKNELYEQSEEDKKKIQGNQVGDLSI